MDIRPASQSRPHRTYQFRPLIDIPQDSRPHSPDKLATLTESLKDGQQQEIGVLRNGDRFELIFGKGRSFGYAELWKATQIRAQIYEALTEAQKLDPNVFGE